MPVEATVTPMIEILTHVTAVGGGSLGTLAIYKWLFGSNNKSKDATIETMIVEQQRTNQQLDSLERTTQEGFKDLNAAILQLALSVGSK